MSPTLESQQRNFAAALTDAGDPRGVIALLAEPPTAAPRLRLYRRNIAAVQATALSRAYPVVRALVGDDYFTSLCNRYGCENPSTSGDLNLFGARLCEFIAGAKAAAALPYLADVAALEWRVHRAYYAADTNALPSESVASLSPAQLLAQRFALQSACAWMRSEFPIATIWRAHQPGSCTMLPESVGTAEIALIVRSRWQVDVLLSDASEVSALTQLRDGLTLADAIAAGLAEDAAVDFTKLLLRWLEVGLLVG